MPLTSKSKEFKSSVMPNFGAHDMYASGFLDVQTSPQGPGPIQYLETLWAARRKDGSDRIENGSGVLTFRVCSDILGFAILNCLYKKDVPFSLSVRVQVGPRLTKSFGVGVRCKRALRLPHPSDKA